MKLHAFVESLNDVPEKFHDLYVTDGNGYRLDAEGVEDVTGLKSALEKERREARTARDRAKAFDGLDPAEVRERLEKLASLEIERKANSAGLTSEHLTKLREEVRADLAREYEPFRSQAEALESELRTLRLDSVVKGKFAKSGVRGDRVDALFKLSKDDFDLTEDGMPMVREKPGVELDKYVTEYLAKEYPEFFEGTGSSGGGALKPTGGTGGGARNIAANDSDAFLANLEAIAKGTVTVS